MSITTYSLDDDKPIYVGSVGVYIYLETHARSLEDVSSVEIVIEKPDASVLNRTGYVEAGTTRIYYATQDGELDQDGDWRIYGWVNWVTPARRIKSKAVEFEVLPVEYS